MLVIEMKQIAAEQKLNSMLQRQAQLRSNIASQTAHQNAISKMGGASPLAGAASAAQGASAAVSGITGKLASFCYGCRRWFWYWCHYR